LIGLLIALSTLSFPVYADSSDLTVDSIWLERASASGVPVAGTDLALNESFNIVASIKNLGQEAANGYYLDVYYDNDYGRGGPDNITAGEVQEWYVGPLTATAGTHTTQWVVDPDNQIAELDEQNNVKQYVFTVGSSEPQTTTESMATVSVTVIQNSTSFSYGTTTTTVTAYSTSTSTSTIPTVTTVVLVPLTVPSVEQSIQYVTSILTTTVTSYTGTETSTSTIVVPTTVTLAPSVVTSTVQTTQVVTSTGTTAITGYTTTTLTSYTGTERSTSTIVFPTTVTLAPLAATSTAQARQVQTSTRTTTETKYTTITTTSYTGTLTSTSTRVVYTTATRLASAGISSPLAYLALFSLLALAVGRVSANRSWRIPQVRSLVKRMCSKSQQPSL
jgi:hypothetical protein